jgi:hypothetical protein
MQECNRVRLLTAAAALAGVLAANAPLAADEISTAKDLTAVIALNGQPCGQVVAVKQEGASNYVATCQDGNRYRVFINAEGRVVVQKL